MYVCHNDSNHIILEIFIILQIYYGFIDVFNEKTSNELADTFFKI